MPTDLRMSIPKLPPNAPKLTDRQWEAFLATRTGYPPEARWIEVRAYSRRAIKVLVAKGLVRYDGSGEWVIATLAGDNLLTAVGR